MMKTTTVKPHCPSYRQKLKDLLDEWKDKVVEAYDRGEKVSLHVHQEMNCFGDPDVFFEMIYQGWTFGVSVGDFPKEFNLNKKKEGKNAKGGRAKDRGKDERPSGRKLLRGLQLEAGGVRSGAGSGAGDGACACGQAGEG